MDENNGRKKKQKQETGWMSPNLCTIDKSIIKLTI